MIDYGELIQQVRTVIPNVLGTVAGAASIDSIDFGANPALPAAFIVPLSFNADPNKLVGGALKQDATETFGIVVVQRSGDLRGQTGANTMPQIRKALWRALLNWRPASVVGHTARNIEYLDDAMLENVSNTGRVFWLFKYRIDLQISHEDGFIPTYDNLTSIHVSVTEQEDIIVIDNLDAPEAP